MYMEECVGALKSSLCNSVKKSIEDAKEIAILFSGGLDSSLLAHLVKIYAKGARITLYTVGTVVSHDMIKAKQASSILNMELRQVVIKGAEIESALPEVAEIIGSNHPVRLSFTLPLYFGLKSIPENLVLSGQGADELFGGYARYIKMEGEELAESLKGDVNDLMNQDIMMDYAIASHFGKSLKTPYLDQGIVTQAILIPPHFKVNDGQRKIVLREAAIELGLSPELAKREKKAAQYSSGIIKELRRIAKRRGMQVNELIEDLLSDSKKG
jgi:asparagine synthase (glutamine-hydrolysing)